MFKKLVSNLPFNPSLIDNISFYAKRLHKEEAIRRIGAVFTVLAMLVQIAAVMSPAKAAYAQSENDIVYGGFSSAESLARTFESGQDGIGRSDIKEIYSHFGISSASQIRAGSFVTISSNQDNYFTYGRSVSSKGYIATENANGTTIYKRRLSVWNVSSWSALQVTNDQGQLVWILQDCGNPTVRQTPTEVGTPRVSLRKEATLSSPSNNEVRFGDVITYRLFYSNTGSAPAEQVEITDALPDQVEFVGIVQSGATLQQSGNSLRFYFGPDKANSTLVTGIQDDLIAFSVRVKQGAALGSFCNSGGISHSGGSSSTNAVCHTLVSNVVTPLPTNYSTTVMSACDGTTSIVTVDGNGIRNIDQVIDGTYPEPFGFNGTLPAVFKIGGVHTFAITVGFVDNTTAGPFTFTTSDCVVNPPTVVIPPVVIPPVVVEMCPQEPSIPKSDWRCVVCPYNPAIITDTPKCVKPPTTQPCQYNAALKPEDPKCKPPCPYNASLLLGDAGCVEAIAECTKLDKPQYLSRTRVRFTVTGRTAGNAKINSFAFNPGDNTKVQSLQTNEPTNGVYTTSVEYTYPEAGNKEYKATMIAITSLGERLTSNCEQLVVIEKEKTPIIVTTKTVSNLTQKVTDANNTTAKPGDDLLYTIRAENVGDMTKDDYTFPKDSIQDLLDYADLTDKKIAELTVENGTQSLVWKQPISIAAGASAERQFIVKVKGTLPKTNSPAGDPTKYDCQIENTLGSTKSTKDTVVVKFDAIQCKPVEQTVRTLPNTGPGSSLTITFIGVMMVVYFYTRSRLLAKEADIIRYEYGRGNV